MLVTSSVITKTLQPRTGFNRPGVRWHRSSLWPYAHSVTTKPCQVGAVPEPEGSKMECRVLPRIINGTIFLRLTYSFFPPQVRVIFQPVAPRVETFEFPLLVRLVSARTASLRSLRSVRFVFFFGGGSFVFLREFSPKRDSDKQRGW